MDFNRHKSNSTYYSDLDIARTHLLCTLFSVGIDQARNEHGNGVLSLRKGSFTIKLGAVKCSFKREIRPYQRYEMWTRVLAWETKWLYTITHFVRRDPKSSNARIVCATAISKCVFKSGRRTIPPEVLLHTSGLLPLDYTFPRPLLPLPVHHHHTESLSRAPQQPDDDHDDEPQPEHSRQEQCEHSKFAGGDAWTRSQGVVKESQQQKRGWTSEMIENERRRGMEVVSLGDLDDLDRDLRPEVEILGTHLDI